MTVPSDINKSGPYYGNGVTTVFEYKFRIVSDDHLRVILTRLATGEETDLVKGTDYSVSDVGNPSGGYVTTNVAPATGYSLTILRKVPFKQETDLENQGAYYAETVEDALDLAVMRDQQLAEEMGRALKIPASSEAEMTLPAPDANKIIGWNADGDGLTNMSPDTLASIVAYGTANADIFTGDGETTEFILTANPVSINNLDVSVGGVTQLPVIDYKWTDGTVITFTTPPPSGVKILARYLQGLPFGYSDSSEVSFVQSGSGAVPRTVQSRLRDVVSVKDFGAVGNGFVDDTAAIMAADAAASDMGVSLTFPPGVYRGYGFKPTASWVGDLVDPSRVVIKSNVAAALPYDFIVCQTDDTGFAGITFDGFVSDDPAVWDSSTFNTWTGSIGLFLQGVDGFSVINCRFENTYTAGLRIESCRNGQVVMCQSRRSRGQFGDGFYMRSSQDIDFRGCRAHDHTRIGFVAEGDTVTGPSANIRYAQCVAKLGRFQGADFGGTEYNVGFWAENSVDVFYDQCLAKDQTRGGFVFKSNIPHGGRTVAAVSYSGCHAVDVGEEGFNLGSLSALSCHAAVVGCSVVNAKTCYLAISPGGSKYVFEACYGWAPGVYKGSTNNNAIFWIVPGGTYGRDTVVISDCEGEWGNIDDLSDVDRYKADVVKYANSASANIHVSNYRNRNARAWIKDRGLTASDWKIIDTQCSVNLRPSGGGSGGIVSVRGGDIDGNVIADVVDIDGRVRDGQQFFVVSEYLSGRVKIKGGVLRHENSVSSKRPVFNVDVDVEKDIAANDYAVRLQYEGSVKPTAVISGTLYNSGAATATNTFVWVVRAGTVLLANGLVTDNSVTNTYRVNTTGSTFAAGEQRVAMH